MMKPIEYLRTHFNNLCYYVPSHLKDPGSFLKGLKINDVIHYLYKYPTVTKHWTRTVQHLLENMEEPNVQEGPNVLQELNLLRERFEKQTNIIICRSVKGEFSNFVEEKVDDCHVCCKTFEENDKPLSCGHWICKECVCQSGKAECPMCRKKIDMTTNEIRKMIDIKKNKNNQNRSVVEIDYTGVFLRIVSDLSSMNFMYRYYDRVKDEENKIIARNKMRELLTTLNLENVEESVLFENRNIIRSSMQLSNVN